MSRFVLDANILLSALAAHPAAPSAVLLNGVHDGQAEAVTCPALITEVRKNLSKRPGAYLGSGQGTRPTAPTSYSLPLLAFLLRLPAASPWMNGYDGTRFPVSLANS